MSAFSDTAFSTSGFSESAFDFGTGPVAEEEAGGHSGWHEKRAKKRKIDELKERVEAMVDEAIAHEVPPVADSENDAPAPVTKSAQKRIQKRVVSQIVETGEFGARLDIIGKMIEALVNENLAARRVERKRKLLLAKAREKNRAREEQDIIAILMLIDSDGTD